MLVQCSSSLVMPVGTPSVSLPINVLEGFLVPFKLRNHVLLHWLSGPGHADFFLHVVSDGPSREMQLDSASWQNWNHSVIFVGVSCHVVPRKFVGIDIQLCGEGQLIICSLLVLVPFDVQHSWAGSDWQQVTSGPNLGQHIIIRSLGGVGSSLPFCRHFVAGSNHAFVVAVQPGVAQCPSDEALHPEEEPHHGQNPVTFCPVRIGMSSISRPTDVEQALSLICAQDPAKGRFGAGCSPITSKQNGFCAYDVEHFVVGNQKLAGVKQVSLPWVECGEEFQECGGMKAGRFHSCFVMSHGRQPTPNNNRC